MMPNKTKLLVTQEMVGAGVRALYRFYDGRFDSMENDAEAFVRLIYSEMRQCADPGAGDRR